jgi:hypothetical protein
MKSAHVASLICILTVLSLSPGAFGKTKRRPEEKTDVGIGIEVASGVHQFHATCLGFEVYFISDKFFKGLRERETARGLEFTKDGKTYQSFPDRLIVHVQVIVFKCRPTDQGQQYPVGYGEGLMSDTSFELNWKGASGSLRPVTPVSVHERHLAIGIKWDYFLDLSSKDVPLTDSLVVDISVRKGTTHIQFSAGLAQ